MLVFNHLAQRPGAQRCGPSLDFVVRVAQQLPRGGVNHVREELESPGRGPDGLEVVRQLDPFAGPGPGGRDPGSKVVHPPPRWLRFDGSGPGEPRRGPADRLGRGG